MRRSHLLWKFLMRVRPAELADCLKRMLGSSRLVVEASNGCRYDVDPVSVLGFTLISEGTYEPGMSALLADCLRPGDYFLDVGGNEGYFTVQAAARQNAKVICVEPQARLQAFIRRNLSLNGGAGDVEILHVALAEAEGMARINLRPSINTGASGVYTRSRFSRAFEDVPCTSVDALLELRGMPRIRLMKVDCEGSEKEVLAGAARALARGAFDYIALEYHPKVIGQSECERIHAGLTEAGYVQRVHLGQAIYERCRRPGRRGE